MSLTIPPNRRPHPFQTPWTAIPMALYLAKTLGSSACRLGNHSHTHNLARTAIDSGATDSVPHDSLYTKFSVCIMDDNYKPPYCVHNCPKSPRHSSRNYNAYPDDLLWIVRTLEDNIRIAGFCGANLRSTQATWLPCELKALAIASVTNQTYLIQSSTVSHACRHSRRCVLESSKLVLGIYLSPS